MRLVRPRTPTARLLACGLLWGFLALVAGCSGGGGSSGAAPFTTNGVPTIRSIEITPANAPGGGNEGTTHRDGGFE